jgi:hypothetical protein
LFNPFIDGRLAARANGRWSQRRPTVSGTPSRPATPGAVLESLTQRRATPAAADLERAPGKQIKNEAERVKIQQAGSSANREAIRLTDREGGPVTPGNGWNPAVLARGWIDRF